MATKCPPAIEIDIEKVAAKAMELSSHSWEYGTAAEALLELRDPAISVFSQNPFPNGKLPDIHADTVATLGYAKQHIRLNGETLFDDKWGVADPAALGVSAILLGLSEPSYLDAAHRQAEYLLTKAPRWSSHGAISHRKDVEEVWADFVYMVPPFLAYYAVASNDDTYLKEAIVQCAAYKNALSTKSIGSDRGLWHHIVGPDNDDPGYWSTSNGWAAAGLARVLATLQKWNRTSESTEIAEMFSLAIRDIVDGAISTDEHRREARLLPNYLYAKKGEPWADDASGTALLASVVYRMAVLDRGRFTGKCTRRKIHYLEWADNKRKAVYGCVDPETGIVRPTVNPLKHAQREPLMTGSPEGQSFVVLLWTAHRDWLDLSKRMER